tara:strand:- start:1166 stop:1891 length:726 start_codon:yes stop_codon:yes gene_type:complete
MDHLIEKLQGINFDCKFTEQIIEKKYNEDNYPKSHQKSHPKNHEMIQYRNFLFCIFDNYDLILSNTPSSDKKITFNQRVSEILSLIDEDQSNYFDNFNYNERTMKKHKIQQNIQSAHKGNKYISSLYYLNDLYKTHFVIVDQFNKEFYETCIKNYPKKYLVFNGKYRLQDSIPDTYQVSETTDWILDILKKNVYKNYLKPISNYKIDELKNIANEKNISIYKDNKIMKKQDIYDKINLTML